MSSQHHFRMLHFKLKSDNAKEPMKLYCRDVGFELFSSEDKTIPSKHRELVETDLSFTFPFGYYGFIISLPDLALKKIDVSYSSIENEIESIKILVINNSDEDFKVYKGDRIALMIVNKYYDNFIMLKHIE